MSILTLNKLKNVLGREGIKVVSIESAHTMGPSFDDITSLDGDIIKAEGQMMIEIRVLMPINKAEKPLFTDVA